MTTIVRLDPNKAVLRPEADSRCVSLVHLPISPTPKFLLT